MEQLINFFKPEHYDLKLHINKETEEVRASVVITGAPQADVIKLHAVGLNITDAKINNTKANYEVKDGVVEISMGKEQPSFEGFGGGTAEPKRRGPVTTGAANASRERMVALATVEISLSYVFTLNHNMQGAYISTYQHQGKEHKIVTTQFESHYARECFPCVDEPAAKATFDLTITTPYTDDTIISNMPAKKEQTTDNEKTVTFQTTPRMSTYLLAFCIGEFHSQTITNQHDVKITTYCALNQSPKTLDYANQIAAEALDYYDDLFQTPYPLPKLDQVALPDFESGAMENWGLVTYRESCLLADQHSPKDVKEYISTVITHELSHQWFGNLVTMQWWDDLWLNESFATVMQYLSIDVLHPEYRIMDEFFTRDCYVALARDAYPGVQAVQQPVHSPDEIATLFDGAIVYAKGAHLIFMLMRLMGRDQFFAGVQDYFKKHEYANTVGDDLWAALQPHADFDVKEFMHAWISQPGYPVIKDTAQQRFLITGETDDTKWPLPQITDDMSGHYLINLSDQEFSAKLSQFKELSLEQRLRLLIDRQLLSKTDLVPSVSLLELLPEFKTETSQPIWDIIATIINDLKIFCPPDSEYYPKYQQFVFSIVQPQLERIGISPKDKEDENDIKLRPILLGFAIYARNQQVMQALASLYHENYTALPCDIREDIIDAKFKLDNEAIFSHLLESYQDTTDPELKSELLATFTDAEQPEHTARLIQLLEQPEIVRPQDHTYLFASLLSNHKTKDKTYDWFYTHWDYIISITGEKTMDDYIRIAAARVRTEQEAERFYDFAKTIADQPAFKRSVEIARTAIAVRLRWLERDAPAIHDFLSKYSAR